MATVWLWCVCEFRAVGNVFWCTLSLCSLICTYHLIHAHISGVCTVWHVDICTNVGSSLGMVPKTQKIECTFSGTFLLSLVGERTQRYSY